MPEPNIKNNSLLCELKDIHHRFVLPNGNQVTVLKDVNLSIFREEVVALLGPSGCGKSTLLRILAGLIRPTTGQVLYHGMPLKGVNPGISIVFQSFALYPWMTVLENVEIVLKAKGACLVMRSNGLQINLFAWWDLQVMKKHTPENYPAA